MTKTQAVACLTTTERKKLIRCEKIIAAGMKTVGSALLIIRDQRLYRAKFSTFEEYCEERFGLTKAAVNYQIQAAQQRKEIGKNFCQTERRLLSETSDSTMRELAQVPKRSQAKVFRKAVSESNGEAPTRKQIAKTAELESKLASLPRGGLANDAIRARVEKELNGLRGEAHEVVKPKTKTFSPVISSIKPIAPSLTKQAVLAAYDDEIASNLERYLDCYDMSVRVRVVLNEL